MLLFSKTIKIFLSELLGMIDFFTVFVEGGLLVQLD